MLKKTKWRFERLEQQVDSFKERLKVLECEHKPEAAERHWLDMFRSPYVSGWLLRCAKCGKHIRDLTEREYLEAMLEPDEEMQARLRRLKEGK